MVGATKKSLLVALKRLLESPIRVPSRSRREPLASAAPARASPGSRTFVLSTQAYAFASREWLRAGGLLVPDRSGVLECGAVQPPALYLYKKTVVIAPQAGGHGNGRSRAECGQSGCRLVGILGGGCAVPRISISLCPRPEGLSTRSRANDAQRWLGFRGRISVGTARGHRFAIAGTARGQRYALPTV